MHIKLFEEFGNEEFFRKVGWTEWSEIHWYNNHDNKYENLSNIEKAWITDKLKPFQPELKWDVLGGFLVNASWTRNEITSRISFTSNDGKVVIELSKISDDWFMLYLFKNRKIEYYICDQFEGLKQFFKEKLGL